MGRAGGLSSQDKKDARKVAESWSKARAVADSHGIHPSQENIQFLFDRIHGSDGDGSQAITQLNKEIESKSITFPTIGAVVPDGGPVPEKGGDPVITTTPTNVPPDNSGDLTAPVPFNSSSDSGGDGAIGETEALLSDVKPSGPNPNQIDEPKLEGGPPEAVAERDAVADKIDNNQFASLGGADQAMLDAANQGGGSGDDGVRVASTGDGSVVVPVVGEGGGTRPEAVASQITAAFSEDEIANLNFGTNLNLLMDSENGAYPLTRVEEAEVLSQITHHAPVKPISEIGSVKEIQAQLSALDKRNDEAAVMYRRSLYTLWRDFNAADLPNVEEMTRDQALQFIQTGWQGFRNDVSPKVLEEHYRLAAQIVQSPANMPTMPTTAAEFEAMWSDINAGGFGPKDAIPDAWMTAFADSMSRVGMQEEFGEALDFNSVMQMDLDSLLILRDELRDSKFGALQDPTVDLRIKQLQGLKEQNAFAILIDGVDNPEKASNLLSRLAFENEADISAGRTPRHSDETVEAVTELHSTLNAAAEQEALYRSGTAGQFGKAVDVIVLIDGIPRIRTAISQGINQYTVPMGDTWDISQLVGGVTEQSKKSLSAFNTSISQNVKDLDIMQRQLMSTLPIAKRMEALVHSDEHVLNFGGSVARAVSSFTYGAASAGEVLGNLFNGKDDGHIVSEAELNQAMANGGFDNGNYTDWVKSVVDPNTLGTAERAAYFEGLAVLMTFRLGMSEGQSGQAMSNQDYKRLSSVLTGARTKEAFSAKLHAFMSDMIGKEQVMQSQLTDRYDAFSQDNAFRPTRQGSTMEGLFEGSTDPAIQDAYSKYQAQYQATVPEPAPSPEEAAQAFTTFVNLAADPTNEQSLEHQRFMAREKMVEDYYKNTTTDKNMAALLAWYSEAFFFGIPPEQLENYIKDRGSN